MKRAPWILARRLLSGFENVTACSLLALIAIFPSVEVVARIFKTGIHANTQYLQHLVIWVTFFGALITSREKSHLSLTLGTDRLSPGARMWLENIIAAISTSVATGLTIGAWNLYQQAFEPDAVVGFIPIRVITIILPAGFFLLTLRFILGTTNPVHMLFRTAGIPITLLVGIFAGPVMPLAIWPLALVLTLSALAGTPIFIVLGGNALLLFFSSGGSTAIIANEAYTMLTGPLIPTIPLFTLAGYLLSESKAGERLVRVFQSCFGWLPGGLAIVATLICAFFTTFTGASGITILALGGLLSVVLLRGNYDKSFSTGLLTATGSIGLLFPPSLPIILYGVVAKIDIRHLFLGGMLPGILMVGMVASLGVRHALKSKSPRLRFNAGEAAGAFAAAAGEIAMPAVTLTAFFCGLTTLVESAALTVVYAFVLEVFIHRDIPLRTVPSVMLKAVPLIGGVLIILSVANGLSYFIIDAQIPVMFTSWCMQVIGNKYLFLLLLNIALLITGCFMDIFSAILVVVPLIVPLGAAFGIDPVHLGIIFIANLELGYLTPPVGLNLFMASYRFKEPVLRIYRYVTPFLVVMIITVLLVTYVPWLTTGLPGLLKLR